MLNDFGGSVDIDDTLVDAHLEAVPGVGTLSAGRLAGGDAENLGGHAGRSSNLNVRIVGSTDEISADCIRESYSKNLKQQQTSKNNVSTVR